jgi:hypothetical protein
MIGAEIPAHLLKNSTNPNPDSDDEDVEGPSIGPQIPEELLHSKRPEVQVEDTVQAPGPMEAGPQIPLEVLQQQEKVEEEEEDYTPALPPELLAQRRSQPSTSKPQSSTSPAGPPRRPIGPSFPSSHLYPNADSDDDDEIGPKPLPPGLLSMHEKDAVTEFMEREERRRKNEEEAKKPKALKREEWMLVPPSASDLLGSGSLIYLFFG